MVWWVWILTKEDLNFISIMKCFSCSGFVSLDLFHVTCSQENVCAVKGSQVTLKCSYYNLNIKTGFWFSQKQSPNWRKNSEPEDLTLDSDYSGRVKPLIHHDRSTLTLSDLRERDSGEYQLMFIMKDGVKRLGSFSVNLTVAGETESRFWSVQLFSFVMWWSVS